MNYRHTIAVLFAFAINNTYAFADYHNEHGWELVWHDEFEGDEINTDLWEHEANCWGGGNNELQCYTDRRENSFLRDGNLIVRADRETFAGPAEPLDWEGTPPDRSLPYTSARLRTLGQGDWKYGRIEVRAKLPSGQGIWPAIWMLPTDWTYGGWAASGEIDIVEAVNLPLGDLEKLVHGTLHYGREWPGQVQSGASFAFEDSDPTTDFHTYSIEWGRREIRWYVDDVHYATQKSSGWYSQVMGNDGFYDNVPGDAPFDQRFHLLINVAVGGNWPGAPDDSTNFPVEMEIDFVRVFTCPQTPETLRACETKDPEAERVFGNVAPEILRVEYDPSVMRSDVVEIYADQDLPPFKLGSYAANGAVKLDRVELEGRGSVASLLFDTDESVVYWQAPFGFDISDFADLTFDLRVVYDPREDGVFMMKMDCVYPCGTGDVRIDPAPVGEWKSFRFSLSDLLNHPGSSLDLTNVDTPLVIFPAWGDQKGVVMQVDNVRLVK